MFSTEEQGDLEALEDSLAEGAAHLAAATCRRLVSLAEFDRRQGWASSGAKSARHWLSWRCGVDPSSAAEMLRVAGRLRELPRVTEAFSRGEFTYSQVRLLVRVATPETEEDRCPSPRYTTCAQLASGGGVPAGADGRGGPAPRAPPPVVLLRPRGVLRHPRTALPRGRRRGRRPRGDQLGASGPPPATPRCPPRSPHPPTTPRAMPTTSGAPREPTPWSRWPASRHGRPGALVVRGRLRSGDHPRRPGQPGGRCGPGALRGRGAGIAPETAGGSAATPRCSRWSRAGRYPPCRWGGGAGKSRPRSAGPFVGATGGDAGSPAADIAASSTAITSPTGRGAGRPRSPTWSACAPSTIARCTRVATRWRDPNARRCYAGPAGTPSSLPRRSSRWRRGGIVAVNTAHGWSAPQTCRSQWNGGPIQLGYVVQVLADSLPPPPPQLP